MPNQYIDIVARMVDEVSSTANKIAGNLNDLKPVFSSMAVVGVAGFAAVSAEIYGSVKAANEAQQVQAQLGAVLKSTGGIAGITADMAIKLSKALQSQTTYGDEAILSAENLLLTFTNISKDIFPNATKIILDMSTALGQDLKSSAIQVGKALQDPVLGVTALRRVGVNFNEAQTEVIKKLVETGQSAKAQALIMKELATEFGGSASAGADTFGFKMAQLKNRINDVQEEIGNALLPTLNKIVDAVGPIINKVGDWIEKNPQLTATIIAITAGIFGLIAVVGTLGIALIGLNGVAVALGVSMLALFGWLLLIPIAIAALVAIGILLWQNWDFLKAKAIEIWGAIKDWVVGKMGEVGEFIKTTWDEIVDFFKRVWDVITEIFKFAVALEVGLVVAAFQAMGIDIFAVFQSIQNFFVSFWSTLQEVFSVAMSSARTMWQAFWNSTKAFILPVVAEIQKIITAVWKWISDTFETASKPVTAVWESMWNGIKTAANIAMEVVKATIQAALNFVISKINAIINAINSVASKGAKGLGISIPQIPTIPLLAEGGIVTRPTLAMIGEAGSEAVIPLSKMGFGGLGGGIVVNINGGTYLSREVAQDIGDMIVEKLKLNMNI